MPRIPLIDDLTSTPVQSGSNLLVEFDPASQWCNASLTIAAGWLKTGGTVAYNVAAQRPENVRQQLKRLGLDTEELEKNGELEVWDWYTATLGQKSKEKFAAVSLKVADLSIFVGRDRMGMIQPEPRLLRIMDNVSFLDRFNDERSWVEFQLARGFPSASLMKTTLIHGIVRGVHSDWAYKTLESASDGIIDLKLNESAEEPRNLMRIRTIRNVMFDGRWHQLKIGENFEVTLQKQ